MWFTFTPHEERALNASKFIRSERRRRIEDHGCMLRERVWEIDQQRTERSAELRLLEGVDAFCLSVRGAMETPSFTVQQKVLQLVVNRIVVEDNRVLIEHVVPTGPVRLQTEHPAAANPLSGRRWWRR